jgi:hypothetical protein
MQEAVEAEGFAGADAVAVRVPHHVQSEHQRQHEARQHAGGIEARYRFLRRRAIDDHRDAGWNDDVDRADRGDEASGEMLRIAVAPHRRIHDAADGGDTGSADAGDRAEDCRGADRGDGEAAAHGADTALHEIDQPLRDAAAPHQLAGIDEERNGKQREGVDLPEHGLVQRRERHVHEEHQRDAD